MMAVVAGLRAQTFVLAIDEESKKDAEYLTYRTQTTPGYGKLLREQRARLKTLARRVVDREVHLQDTSCSRQILSEIDWLTGDTSDFARTADRLNDLESVLSHPEAEATGKSQDPADGSWGRCYSEWFFKVSATYDHVTKDSSRGDLARYELRLLDRVNSPQKLAEYFASVALSDISRTGRDNRRELNESLENLGRLILRGLPASYGWDPRLKDAMMNIILNNLRNPRTGWWGSRYVHSGKEQFVDDLSITFHMVTSLNGKVPDLDKAMGHLLAVKDLDYPVGWLKKERYSNHHEMDVITLFSYGWPYMKPEQRRSAAVEIGKVIRWCMDHSLQSDGSFAFDGSGDSIEEETSFGVSLLARAGVFDKARRFWTSSEFPESEEDRNRIIGFIRKHMNTGGAGGSYYEGALQELGASQNIH